MLLSVGLSGRNDANDAAFGSIAVTDEQKTKGGAETQKDESVFQKGMIGVVDEDSVFVEKDRHGLGERYAVAADVEAPSRRVPLEAKVVSHPYIVVERLPER